MERGNGLRGHMGGSIRSRSGHQHDDSSEAESSDEFDDDIPATLNRRSNASPAKPPAAASFAQPHTSPLKRSLSDAARDGIVLYSGSKQPRNGYNMLPVSLESLPRSLSGSSPVSSRPPRAPIRSPSGSSSGSPLGSPSIADNASLLTEDDVRQGLVSNMNNVFNHSKTRQAQDLTRQRLPPEEEQNFPRLNGVKPTEHEYEESTDQDPGPGPAIPAHPTSGGPHLKSDGITGVGEEEQETSETTHRETRSAENKDGKRATPPSSTQGKCVLDGEKRAEIAARAQVDVPLRDTSDNDIWNVPQSPSTQDHSEVRQNSSPRSNEPPLPRKSRSPNISKGEPQKPVPSISSEGAELPRNPSPGPNEPGSLQLTPAKDLVRASQDGNSHAPATVPGLIQSQVPMADRQSQSIRSTSSSHSQIAEKSNIRAKTEKAKDAARPVNQTVSTARDSKPDEPPRVLRHNNDLAKNNSIDDCRPTNIIATVDDGNVSDFIDEFNTELGGDNNTCHAKEGFVRDEANLNDPQGFDTEDRRVFDGLSDKDVTAIHLDHQPLQQLCKLLSDASWAGVESDWQWQRFDYEDAETEPGRVLLSLLAKLETLYRKSPEAPNLKEQARFLRGHANTLRYYFDKIQLVVEYIDTKRLEIPERSGIAQNTDPRKRKRMARDLVLYVIPMLVHVLASAWGLGGETWLKTSFTSTAVELLQHALDWTMALHSCLSRELKQCPLEEEPEDLLQKKAWQKRNAYREAIGPLLDNLGQVIAAAPDRLAKAKIRAKKQFQRREEPMRQEAQLDIEQIAAKKTDATLANERKKRPRPPTASFSATAKLTEWSIEEQTVLFRHIQNSYPACPDLNHVRWELNKTFTETATMAENILGKMLDAVLRDWSPEERAAKVRKIMRTRSSS